MAYAPGNLISGRYKIIRKVGEGAHGVVYRCRDLENSSEVAVKFLGDQQTLGLEYRKRIEREAVAMARLRGTSAVYVHALNVDEQGALYMVMEMLHGCDLEAFLVEAESKGGRLKAHKLLELMRPIVDTLESAHGQGIVHRDLKPSNVFLVDRNHGGGVRLLDFGLAKFMDASRLTADGMVAGTPSYIAPEAWAGLPQTLDQRVDVYSLGMLLFRALSGVTPTQDKNILDVCRWATTGTRPRLTSLRPSLPVAIDTWVQRALAINPADRFQSVRTLLNAFEACFPRPSAGPF